MEIWHNPAALERVELGPFTAPDRQPLTFHQQLPRYAPTPLLDVPGVARQLGVAQVLVKDECTRMGLPSYKVLGASWAVHRRLVRLGHLREPFAGVEPAREELAAADLTLVAATDGNHGRAVARMAALLGLRARIYVPDDMVPPRVAAIAGEGADVIVVDGGYDEAVDLAGAQEDSRHVVISDTAYPGYDEVPRWVSEGYSTIFWEVEEERTRRQLDAPTVVAVQMGVGALATAVVRHYRGGATAQPPRIVGVEPIDAACVLASARAGELVELEGPQRSIMAGLNCGRASSLALPLLMQGIDIFTAVDDDRARAAMRVLADADIVAGESGAAGLAGITALAEVGALRVEDRVLVINTEGATDPAGYEAIVGRPAPAS